MHLSPIVAALLAQAPDSTARRVGRRGRAPAPRGWSAWLREPRNAVWIALLGLLAWGGARRLRQWWQAREAVDRLAAENVAPDTIRDAARHGRAGLLELFRILGTAPTEAQRNAAGQALAAIWKQDDLIAEEEKAVVRRGFDVVWRARRRYPRGLRVPIPIAVSYGVPFLGQDAGGVAPEHLEWSHRIVGARRADLEVFTPWTPGPGRAEFAVYPDDFAANGPHRLVLEAKARTAGLTAGWELELPHVAFSFEFDPRLAVEALLAAPDQARGEVLMRSIRLEGERREDGASYLNLNDSFALRYPPGLVVATPLSFDLAHTMEVEIEGVPGLIAAGELIVSGQGASDAPGVRRFPFTLNRSVPNEHIDRAGMRRLRLMLTADPQRGWADPDVRSLWPETVTTDWVEVEVVRR